MPVGVMARVATCILGPGTSPFAMAFLTSVVRVQRSFGFQVSHRCEPVGERSLGVARRQNRPVRDRFLQQLSVVFLPRGVAMQKQMGVCVDKPGESGRVRVRLILFGRG